MTSIPTKDEIFIKLRKHIADNNKMPEDQITMDSSFEALNMDSLDGITVLNDLEGQYNITLPNDVVMKMKSVREVVDGVHEYLSKPETHVELTPEYQRSQIPQAPKEEETKQPE